MLPAEHGAALAVGTEGAGPALGKGLMPPACSMAAPVQPESNQSVFGSVQREHVLSLAAQVLQRGLHPWQVPQTSGTATGSSPEHHQGHMPGYN